MAYFSILIPVFNQVGLMDECINSIKNQSFDDYEVIMVNDGSTDDSQAMLEEIVANDERFKVVKHDNNKSLLAARFTAMNEANGSHVVFVDSDDYIEPNMLKDLHDKFEDTKVDIVLFGFIMEPMDDRRSPIDCEDLWAGMMDGVFPPAIWKNAYSIDVIKKALEKGESFYCNMGEDSYMSTILFSNAKTHTVLDEKLYHYVLGAGMSNADNKTSLEKIKKAYLSMKNSGDHIIEYAKKYKPEYVDKAKEAASHMYKYLLLQNVVEEMDIEKVVRYVNFFDTEETKDIYEFGCRELLKFKYQNEGKKVSIEDFFAFAYEG